MNERLEMKELKELICKWSDKLDVNPGHVDKLLTKLQKEGKIDVETLKCLSK